jgi:hypothetical protein
MSRFSCETWDRASQNTSSHNAVPAEPGIESASNVFHTPLSTLVTYNLAPPFKL